MRGVGSNAQVFAPVVFVVPVVFAVFAVPPVPVVFVVPSVFAAFAVPAVPVVFVVPSVFAVSAAFAVPVVFTVSAAFAAPAALIALTDGTGVGELETTCQCPGAVTVNRNVAFRSGCSNTAKTRRESGTSNWV